MVEFSTILQFIQAAGIIVGVAYYIMNIQNNQKNQELVLKAQQQQLETRQAQLFMQLFDSFTSVETLKIDFELMDYTWKDYDDFVTKYGSKNNLEATAKRQSLHYRFDCVGWLVRCKIVDLEWAYNQLSGLILFHWVKYKSLILEERRRTGWMNYFENFEYLAEEFERMGKSRGFNSETVKQYKEWIPEASSP